MTTHEHISPESVEGTATAIQAIKRDTEQEEQLLFAFIAHYKAEHEGENRMEMLIDHFIALMNGELRIEVLCEDDPSYHSRCPIRLIDDRLG